MYHFKDGLEYTPRQDCDCSWTGNEIARLIRIYPHGDWLGADDSKRISSFFLVGGSKITNPAPVRSSHVNAITAGFQARLSLNVINPQVPCDDSLQMNVTKGNDVIMQNGVAQEMKGVIHHKVHFLEENKRCLVLFMIEAFQFNQSDLYTLQVGSQYTESRRMEVGSSENYSTILRSIK